MAKCNNNLARVVEEKRRIEWVLLFNKFYGNTEKLWKDLGGASRSHLCGLNLLCSSQSLQFTTYLNFRPPAKLGEG